ncbi:GNAT family N-acetyltransferase [Streptacidiphilus sp. ASG 303]|nr:GNAT family N-acetyltransferase [Streptacidiphilus sp. ASG 303]MCD0485871.1 GNAT family N-acetyltransferase [Streptacidiphilus sp. ASG 303]
MGIPGHHAEPGAARPPPGLGDRAEAQRASRHAEHPGTTGAGSSRDNSLIGPVRPGRDPLHGHLPGDQRLVLRRFTADDAELLIELDSDPAVMRYLTGGEATAPETVRERHLPFIIAGYERWGGDLGLFAAHERDSGGFIGWFCLRPGPDGPRDEAELGYRLRRAAWGNGYATEVSQALLHKGFTALGVRMVWAETMAVNRGSRKVVEKLGMRLVETLPTPPDMERLEGAEHGGVRYEITMEQGEQR